jgi:hypothetical protein
MLRGPITSAAAFSTSPGLLGYSFWIPFRASRANRDACWTVNFHSPSVRGKSAARKVAQEATMAMVMKAVLAKRFREGVEIVPSRYAEDVTNLMIMKMIPSQFQCVSTIYERLANLYPVFYLFC